MMAKEMTTIREYNVGRFRGNYPDVETAEGVDLDGIRARDAHAMFVTLPIAEIGAISANGLLYDETTVDSIAEQINTKRPGGIFGHLKDEERTTSFPLPAGLWIGAKRVGQTLWAKSYIPPGAARDYVQNLKDVGGEIATSIYGRGKFEKVRDGVRRLTSFDLESLDFAPPTRAALGLGAIPHVTAEMQSEMSNEQEPIMADKQQIISELTVADIPATLREQIVAEAIKQDENTKVVAELTSTVKAKDEVIAELNQQIEGFRLERLDAAIDGKVAELTDWQVSDDAGKEKLNKLRALLKSQILTRLGSEQKMERVAEMATAAWEDLKPIAEMMRDALAGPAALVNGKVRDAARPKLEDTPENRQRAAAEMGINI
jgi:hypothetical protein